MHSTCTYMHMQCGARCGPEVGGRGAAAAQASCRRGPNCGSCWEGTRRAHPKHVLHVCDFGRVEAQRLVERRGTLPSHKEARGGRHAGREAIGCGVAAAQATRRRGSDWESGAGHARSAHKTWRSCL